jgi:SAM-dependent methyltransferase
MMAAPACTDRTSCPLCGAGDLLPVAEQALRCRQCALLINRQAAALDYAEGGGQAPPDANKMRWRLENARMRLALVEPCLNAHQVLVDIGCGSGEMLEAGRGKFAACIGFDVNAPLIEHIRRRGNAMVFESHFDAALIPATWRGRPTLFALSHVLEHLEQPMDLIGTIVAAMAPGDLLYVEVPLHSGQSFRTQGFAWNLWNHEHVALYSMTALDLMAQRAELDVLHRGTRVFARGSHSDKTRLRLMLKQPLRFFRTLLTKGRHSIADLMIADYGCIILRKP